MQRRSAKGSIRLCTVLGDFVPMDFRASVCIFVIEYKLLTIRERIGATSMVVLWVLAGCMTKRTVQASGLKQGGGSARRAVSASGLSAGTNTISPDLRRDTHAEMNP